MKKRRVLMIILCALALMALYVFMRRGENALKNTVPWPVAITWDEPYVGYVDLKCFADGYSQYPVKIFLRDDEAAFCLPAFASGKRIIADFDGKYFEVSIDGNRIGPGDEILSGASILDITYISDAYGRIDRSYDLKVMYSGNLPAVFVETKSGSLEYMDEDKANLDSGYITCIAPDGADLNNVRIDSMRAKGQSSFTLAKKNYKVKLQKKTALLGMETGNTWVLLANAMDTSRLRNATAYELASILGLEGVVDYRFTDMYFNGEYHGNYMVVQSVDHYFEKHNATDRDSFLLEKETWEERLKSDAVYIRRDGGVYWEFIFPALPGDEYVKKALFVMDRFESVTEAACEGNDLTEFSSVADERSFAAKYILDVLTNEPDSNSHSTFCTYDSLTGKFSMTPVWDYDRAWGNRPEINRYPFFESFSHSWPEQMTLNPSYLDLCRRVMEDSSDDIEALYENGIDEMASYIEASWKMDRCVNGGGISTVTDFEDQEKNTVFLKASFEDIYKDFYDYLNVPDAYAHVYFENREGRAYRIKKGECIPFEVMEYLKKMYSCDGFVSDGGAFDDNSVVEGDMVVSPMSKGK